MFDFAWTEIALIGVVALVLIGPKDLPIAIKTVAGVVKKMRKMAGEFQSQMDEMVKDTSLAEVRQQIAEIRNMDIRGEIEKAVDADGSIRAHMNNDPFRQMTPHAPAPESYVPPAGSHSIEAPADEAYDPAHGHGQGWQSPAFEAPAFVPPGTPPPVAFAMPAAPPPPPAPPAFIPPGATPPDAPRA
jgi:sec-independent protein translocase protein TatB